MSASYFDLLKYAATGKASPDMTYYDRMRASTLMGGATVQTLTGQPPLSFKSDGTPLISWSMKGNGSQQGTPTPDNPVMPEFVGVETGNLWNPNSTTTNQVGQPAWGVVLPAGVYTIVNNSNTAVYQRDGIASTMATTFAAAGATKTVRFNNALVAWTSSKQTQIMLSLGSTALPYEPYGWAVKITCAGQTVPVYLGQVSTVRKIRKLVLTGEEEWTYITGGKHWTPVTGYLKSGLMCICTHYEAVGNASGSSFVTNGQVGFYSTAADRMIICDTNYTTTENWKSYLAQQYANGTPVTIWYVLATPQTAIVNEPLAKIGDYADELSSTDAAVTIPTAKGSNTLTVDTTIQPSEMTITFKG